MMLLVLLLRTQLAVLALLSVLIQRTTMAYLTCSWRSSLRDCQRFLTLLNTSITGLKPALQRDENAGLKAVVPKGKLVLRACRYMYCERIYIDCLCCDIFPTTAFNTATRVVRACVVLCNLFGDGVVHSRGSPHSRSLHALRLLLCGTFCVVLLHCCTAALLAGLASDSQRWSG